MLDDDIVIPMPLSVPTHIQPGELFAAMRQLGPEQFKCGPDIPESARALRHVQSWIDAAVKRATAERN